MAAPTVWTPKMIYDRCNRVRLAVNSVDQNATASAIEFRNILADPNLKNMPNWKPVPNYERNETFYALMYAVYQDLDAAGIGGENVGIALIERYFGMDLVARIIPEPDLDTAGKRARDRAAGLRAGRGDADRFNQQEAKKMEQDDLARKYEELRNRQPRMQHLFSTNGPKASGKLYKIEPMNTQLRSDMETYIQGAFVLDHTYIELLYGRVNLGMSRYDYDYFWESPWYPLY